MIFDFVNIDPINKGFSSDKKYCASLSDGNKYLLRLSNIDSYEKKKEEFHLMKLVEALDIPMCLPIDFGIENNKVYSIHSWIYGEAAENYIPKLSENEQYLYGIKSGTILKRIHSIPLDNVEESWDIRFNRKMNKKLEVYSASPLKFDGGTNLINYINENRNLLKDRPQSYHHGDYHIGNMLIEKDNLKIIDFDRYDYGDPFEEFNRIVWSAQKSPLFASGMVDGYFNDNPPLEFWKLLALYISSNTLGSLAWAFEFGEDELIVILNQANEILKWYDNMKNIIPTWYKSK